MKCVLLSVGTPYLVFSSVLAHDRFYIAVILVDALSSVILASFASYFFCLLIFISFVSYQKRKEKEIVPNKVGTIN